MIQQAVASSNIAHAGHEDDTLFLKFNSGAVYKYPGVPADIYHALVTAESAGKFFHREIRSKFPHILLEVNPFAVDLSQGGCRAA